ncbi:prepilin peptidase [Futiania mangrovi]|uniref:A24 family peptidase n=1 Tax=Futiania mangrovi TaxID=2959716 RepID=A0A9J6PJC8_9PROT|nr:A24 family peptidase [Futiania mangrovii]MCP1337883.1 A24 family peptidase [Futiania mangrovii]
MNPPELASAAVLTVLLAALAVSDARRYVLPDVLNLALAVCGFVSTALLRPDVLPDAAIGCLAGFAAFAGIAAAYRRLRGRDGLGLGDAKLMGAAGAWVGWQGLSSVVLIGAFAALAATLAMAKLRGETVHAATRVPLGIFLALGLWITWMFGPLTA